MTAKTPGAINLDANDLADDMIVAIDTTGQRSAQTTLANLAQYMASESLGNVSNTDISTVGAGTLTAAGLKGGLITRSGSTAAYTDTTATAAQLLAALGSDAVVGTSWLVYIKNTVAFAQTISGGTNVTLSGQTIIPPNSVGVFLLTYSAATPAFTMRGIAVGPMTTSPLEANTAITTVGAGTLTAAGLVGGVITRSGSTAAYTDTTATAAQIIAALPNANVGQSWEVTIKNTVAFAQTLAAGAGVTLSGQTIIPPNSAGRFLLTYSAAGAVTMQGLAMVPLTTSALLVSTALDTVGAGTITAAGIAGGVTARGGAQVAAVADTTDTAANIIAARPNANIGESWEYTYRNNTSQQVTITGGTGVNAAGAVGVVSKNSWAKILVTYTAAATITMAIVASGPNVVVPASKYTAAGDATVVAGALTGADFVNYENTGNNATVTTRTGTQMFGDIPNCQIGYSYQLAIRNTHATTLTLTAADASVTLTGTMTIAQNVTRMFNVIFTSATECTITSMGISAAAA